MPRYGDLDKLKDSFKESYEKLNELYDEAPDEGFKEIIRSQMIAFMEVILRTADAPTADVVEIETLKAWLYEIAMNNVGCDVDDFASACEEIASRLDGLRAFARERKNA